MKQIVITGATSMIGMALILECLEYDMEIYAVARGDSPKLSRLPQHERLHIVEGDLEHLRELPAKIPRGCDTFYHFAWAHTGENRNRSVLLQSKNIDYTLDAVQAAHALGCERFIGAGSQAEYGPMDVERIRPDSPVHPATPYGAAKLAAGHLAGMLCAELEMACIWPRFFSIYGIYEKETTMIASSLRKMLRGEATAYTPAGQRWDYLYSRDAGRACRLIGEKGRPGAVYCVGSGRARPLRDYILEMTKLAGASNPGIGALPYPPGAVMNLCADITELTRDTGFEPACSFEEGIRETIAWLRSAERVECT